MTANVALTDTFDQWRVKTNEVIVGTQSDGMANILKTTDTTNSTSNTTGSIITAGGVGVAKSAHIGGDLKVWGDVTTVGDTTISGNLTFGDASTDQVTFSADINSSLIPNANLTFNIGNTTMQWANTWAGHVGITQKTDSGKPALSVTSTDTNVIAIDIDASQIDADVIDIAADAVTTAKVIDITADSLTTGSALYIEDDSAATNGRSTMFLRQNNAAAIGAAALDILSNGGVTGATLDKNFSGAAAATVRGLHVDFDRSVPGSGTAAFTDIGIDLDVNAAGLGTTTTTGLDVDVVGATSGTHTATGINIAVGSADTNYALITSGGNVGISTAAPAYGLEVTGTVGITGASTMIGALTVGVDGTGHDVTFYGDTAGSFMLWDQSDDALELTDSSPIKIGDGGDMQLYHDGTNSFITNQTGVLQIATLTSGIAIHIGHGTSETSINDNLTVAGTTALTGVVSPATHVDMPDSAIIKLGTGDDLQLYHSGSHSFINNITGDFNINTSTGSLTLATGTSGVAVSIGHTTSETTVNDNLNVTGSIDVDGISDLDTVRVGVDDTGYDVTFFGATASRKLMWDESADELLVHGKISQRFGSAFKNHTSAAWVMGG